MNTILDKLIAPHSKTEFLTHYQGNKPLFIENINDQITELRNLETLNSLESLLDFWPVEVDVHLPDIADEASSISMAPQTVMTKYQEGMSLLFNDINDFDTTLNYWVQSLRQDLGLSKMTYSRNLVYATPKGGGTSTHFDQNINFIIQLKGTKKWWVSPNNHVDSPLTRHTAGLETDPELTSYIKQPFPSEMPNDAQEFTLTPGSMLFLPRGSWHKTHAESDALALNFTFSAPSWLDLFGAAMRARLVQSPDWRETADFVSDPQRYPIAMEKFDTLLNELASEADQWRAENILGMTES